jgi:hypothetical protein
MSSIRSFPVSLFTHSPMLLPFLRIALIFKEGSLRWGRYSPLLQGPLSIVIASLLAVYELDQLPIPDEDFYFFPQDNAIFDLVPMIVMVLAKFLIIAFF